MMEWGRRRSRHGHKDQTGRLAVGGLTKRKKDLSCAAHPAVEPPFREERQHEASCFATRHARSGDGRSRRLWRRQSCELVTIDGGILAIRRKWVNG